MDKEILDRLQKSVENMIGAVDPNAPTEMTPDQFVAYVADQIAKAEKDSPEVRVERLKALGEAIEVAKNFEGPTTGAMRIPMFKDPAQRTHTTQQGSAPQNAPQASNFGANDAPPAQAGVGNTPAGGDMPPKVAGGSGFDSPATATFAKAMEDVSAKLDTLLKSLGEDEAPETPAAGGGEGNKPATQEAKVEKSTGVLWPHDMNTAFGLQNDGAPEDPPWGYDPGSKMAEVMKAKAAEKKPAESDQAAE